MVDKIEMSLDDIIKSNRSQKKGTGGGRGRAARGGQASKGGSQRGGANANRGGSNRKPSGAGGVLKGRGRAGIQKTKFSRGDVNSAWKHDLYDGPKRGILKTGGVVGGSDVSKVLVSNLDYGVSDSDIRELFHEFGPLKKAAVHYDRSGRSLGTAEVIFERRADALKAIKQYHGVPLDGRPMNIQLTTDVSTLDRLGVTKRRFSGNVPARRGGAAGSVRGRKNGPGTGPKRGGGAGGRTKPAAKTAEELDAELDAYVNDMKI